MRYTKNCAIFLVPPCISYPLMMSHGIGLIKFEKNKLETAIGVMHRLPCWLHVHCVSGQLLQSADE